MQAELKKEPKPEFIEKDPEKLKLKPNLEDYDYMNHIFCWDDAKNEIEFFEDGKLNIAHNSLDRHNTPEKKNKTALIWEDDDGNIEKYTYEDLVKETNKFANVLKKHGVKKGDRIFIFMPRIPALYISFLGTLKTGAIAGTLFAAFGHDALLDRLSDSSAKFVVTHSTLKDRIYSVKDDLPNLKKIIITDAPTENDFEIDYKKEMKKASDEYEVEHMDPEDEAFMLYTSGTTGKPKGVVHRHLAVAQEHLTAKWVLDIHEEDMYWCTADPGWVTGIAYGIIGPLSNYTTMLVHGGRFSAERWYELIQKYKVTIWYTAPTAVRLLMKNPDILKKYDLSSLRYACSVGEPLNPEAVRWGNEKLGLPFHDNYWQTETGSIVIANYPSMPIKVGYMGKPFPGIVAGIIDEEGNELPDGEEGNLALKPCNTDKDYWPSQMLEIWHNEAKFESYFNKGWYLTGDKAKKDADGYILFVGRADDVIKTAGHRVGPYEVESALIEHPSIAEAGVIGKPDETYGEIIKAFVVLRPGAKKADVTMENVKHFMKDKLAGHAYPKEVEVVKSLPKTRSGKIMRRMLKAKELGQDLGDTSTLEKD
ncbi:acetate--CoA ligase [Nanoarchaeota archaeon]